MPQQASSTPVPGVTHPQFEDDSPNFWHDLVAVPNDPNNDNPSYVSQDVPAFIKQGVDMNKVTQKVQKPETQDDASSIATVYDDKPYDVNIYNPSQYGTSVRNHELTHTFQDTRSGGIPKVSAGHASVTKPEDYEYGWVQGLEKARNQGKTISSFNVEQQADMVEDYKKIHDLYLDKAKKGTITPDDERRMYRAQKAYHPFVSQLAKMPAKDVPVTSNPLLQLLGYKKPPTIDTKPEAPGLPSYDTPGLGVLPADPLMGGKSRSTSTSYDVGPQKGRLVPGMLSHGNIDVNHRIQVKNSDGSGSSIFSVTRPIDKDGKAIPWEVEGKPNPSIKSYALIPGIDEKGKFFTADGKKPNEKDKQVIGQLEDRAADYYNKTGHHLGIFKTSKDADTYAGQTHAWTNDGTDKKVYTPSYEEPRNFSKSLQPKKKTNQ